MLRLNHRWSCRAVRSRSRPRASLSAVLALLVLVLAGCSDDAKPTATDPAGSASIVAGSPVPYPEAARTKIAVVDAAIDAAVRGDATALQQQLILGKVACATEATGPFPSKPKCVAGEVAGTPVEALLVGTGEGAYIRKEELGQTVQNWLGASSRLYSVKELSSPDERGGRYHVVFVTASGQGNSLFISDKGIVMVSFNPSFKPAQVAARPAGKFILAPK